MLWESLISIAESVRGPWPVIGDFNTILQYHDQSGGSSNPSWRGAQDQLSGDDLRNGAY